MAVKQNQFLNFIPRTTAIALIVVCSLIPATRGRAQGVVAWSSGTVYLGIQSIRCDCTVSGSSPTDASSGARLGRFSFRSEPTILGVVPGGPGDGILRQGDVITHVNGVSILSSEGARRFSSISPGDNVALTVRRSGVSLKVVVHAAEPSSPAAYSMTPQAGGFSYEWETPPAPPAPAARPSPVAAAAPAPSRVYVTSPAAPSRIYVSSPAPASAPAPAIAPGPPVAVWATVPPRAPAVVPRGWFGFSIRCSDCGWSSSGSSVLVWESNDPPEIAMVSARSPAGRAGFKPGDVITHIDGFAIMSEEGSRRFGGVTPGQKVRLTIRRGASSFTRNLTLESRPETRVSAVTVARGATAPSPARAPRTPSTPVTPAAPQLRREMRYSGQIDNVTVEVWSPGGPSVEKVGDTMIITLGASVVRLKVDPAPRRD